jgi:hypothetical protein
MRISSVHVRMMIMKDSHGGRRSVERFFVEIDFPWRAILRGESLRGESLSVNRLLQGENSGGE